MGTRADFYVGRGVDAEWLGSIAFDGYQDGKPKPLLGLVDEGTYRSAVAKIIAEKDHGTSVEDGWPWPWDDSGTTDYAYAFDGGKVWASSFGSPWFLASDMTSEDDEVEERDRGKPGAVFPNMKERQRVTFGKRSGIMLIGRDGPIEEP